MTIPTRVETSTWIRSAEGEPWRFVGEEVSYAETAAELYWTGEGQHDVDVADRWVCIGYTFPPTVWLCPKPYVFKLARPAAATGSITYGGLDATLYDPAYGQMSLGVFQ